MVLGRVLWSQGGHGSVWPALQPAQGLCSRPLRDLPSLSSPPVRTDGVPNSRTNWLISPAPARPPQFCQISEGYWGPTELRGHPGPGLLPLSPRDTREVTGAAAGGPQTQLLQDGSTCTFETPGFLLSPHSRCPTRLQRLLTLAPIHPLTLGGLGGLRKVGLGQERQRDRAQTLSPRGCSKATPASNSTAPGLQLSARV